MSSRFLFGSLVILFTVSGCSVIVGDQQSDPAPSLTASSVEEPENNGVKLGTEPPEFNARSTGNHRGIAQASCNINRSLDAARDEALSLLRKRAASNGADYVRVSGSGDLMDRGFCVDGYLRIDGEGFVELKNTGTSDRGQAVDSLSSRLEELEGLRDRGLLDQAEYEQLRERVLDEAY